MKIHNFLGGDQGELFFEEVDIKFLVHKSLINDDTRGMIQRYMASLKAPPGIRVDFNNNVYTFKPAKYDERNSGDENNYILFAL